MGRFPEDGPFIFFLWRCGPLFPVLAFAWPDRDHRSSGDDCRPCFGAPFKGALYFLPPFCMEKDCLAEAVKGNARCRLHEYTTIQGDRQCLLEISAYNGWADQWKLLFAAGCVPRAEGEAIVRDFDKVVRGYSWHDEDFVLEE